MMGRFIRNVAALAVVTALGISASGFVEAKQPGAVYGGPSFGQIPPVPGQEPTALQPMADPAYDSMTTTVVSPGAAYVSTPSCVLYECVDYRRERNIAPCAVPKIVSIKDPCNPCQCVCVKICVPPCACEEEVKVRRGGDKVIYDYGKYSVELTSSSRRGIIVTYHD
ncbi:hypothetical protein [Planctopirus hydrillae]|uniref:Uncharacterized protein n=1 Tax=Planctopirus hydrillae TaxID=1841610 RepID=A0A1C3EJZ5_9PLAN|nr:hypothetical protein [Planctopirus hydrillae]ODA33561.1 hypothetical protein A6X21_18620 [Planctopirus hydrillae]